MNSPRGRPGHLMINEDLISTGCSEPLAQARTNSRPCPSRRWLANEANIEWSSGRSYRPEGAGSEASRRLLKRLQERWSHACIASPGDDTYANWDIHDRCAPSLNRCLPSNRALPVHFGTSLYMSILVVEPWPSILTAYTPSVWSVHTLTSP